MAREKFQDVKIVDEETYEVTEADTQEDGDAEGDAPAKKDFFGRFAFAVLSIVVFLLPLFFFGGLALPTAKAIFFYGATFLLVVAAIISVLKNGRLSVSKHILILAAIILPIVFLVSTLFSGAISTSFFGLNFDIGTTLSILAAVSFMLIIPAVVKTKDSVFTLYSLFLLSFLIVAVFQLLRLIFGPSFLAFGIFTDPSTNLIGKWNELSIFFGLSSLLSLVTLETFTGSKRSIKVIMVIVLVVSLFFLGIVNFSYALYAVGIFALMSFVYLLTVKKKMSFTSLAVVLFAIVFIFFGTSIQNHLPSNLNISEIEVSPAWGNTATLVGDTLRHEPIVGVGPNEFTKQWLAYKPADVNSSVFWNVDFSYAVGLVPTYFVTTGILGILAWLLFFIALIYTAFKSLFLPDMSVVSRYLTASSFFAALYLWVFQIVYVPSMTLFVLTFFFTGIFIAVLVQDGIIATKTILYVKNQKLNFALVFGLVVALAAILSLFYVVGEKTLAAFYANRAVNDINVQGDVTTGEADLDKAISLDPQAPYYRTLAQIDIAKENAILSQTSTSTAAIQSQFQAVWPSLLSAAESALAADPSDYQNYLLLGDIYQSVLPFGYQDAFTLAQTQYQDALKLDPYNPLIYLSLAELDVANSDNPGALTYIDQALVQKPNYTDAIYLESEIQINEGDIKDAIASAEQAVFLDPSDPTLLFQLGFLEYSNKDYADAITALTQAVSLSANYANAQYYLGLSYAYTGKTSQAIAEFVAIEQTNPGNTAVEAILANLRAGKDPLAATAATTTASKTKTSKLPVSDGGAAQ